MSNLLRAFCVFAAVTLGLFLPLGGWYWFGFQKPPTSQLNLLKQAMPQLSRMLQAHEDEEVEQSLAQLDMTVIIADAGGVAITSNLGNNSIQYQQQGAFVLNNESLPFLTSDQGDYRFYYRVPLQWLDFNLLFPLFFSCIVGLLAALWDYLQRERLNDQTDTLILLNQQQQDEDENKQRLRVVQAENKQLKIQLMQQGGAAPKPLVRANSALADVEKLQNSLKQMQSQNDALRQKLAHAKDQPHDDELHKDLSKLSQSLATTQDYEQALRQQIVEYEEQLHLMYEHQKRLQNDFEQAQEREQSAKSQLKQLHELEQSVVNFKQQHAHLLKKEEQWSKDKRKLMVLSHEKEVQNKKLREQMKATRERLRELSVAYKKLNEKVDNLPASLAEAQSIIHALIEAKEDIEQANLGLNLDKAERSSEIHRLYNELNTRAERLTQAQNMIEELAEELKKYQREMVLLGETLEDKLVDLELAQDLHDEDQQVLASITQERDRLRLDLDQLKDGLDVLREDKAKLAFEKQSLEEKIESLDVDQFRLEIEQLRQSLQLMGAQQQRRNKTIEELKEKLKQGEQLYNRLKKHSEAQSQELQSIHQESDRYRSEIQLLEDKIYTLESLQYGGK